MAEELARRDLLKGRFKPARPATRPPYAIAESRFLSLCEPCGDCIAACPNDIIHADPSGRPELDFGKSRCLFCQDCATACTTGALDQTKARPWNIKARITPQCLSLNGIACRSCGDHCEHQAITFKLMTRGRSQPLVSEQDCTGCGACVPVCPNKSIEMTDSTIEEDRTT